jgi:hypothetical protein
VRRADLADRAAVDAAEEDLPAWREALDIRASSSSRLTRQA